MLKFNQFLWVKLHNVKKRVKDGEKGLTLVEVVIALLIISIITAIVIHSSIMAIDTSEYNKTKTIAISIANEEMEKIRAMDYGDIGIAGGDPEGTLESEAVNPEGYTINYDVSWVEGEDSYKQVAVSVFKQPMKVDVEVITQIYPSDSSGAGGEEGHPAPTNLIITSDTGEGDSRAIVLEWSAPVTDLNIVEYKIYRDGSYIGSDDDTSYIDNPGGDGPYTYYVTALYEDGEESGPSNEVVADELAVHPPPQNLEVLSDEGNGKWREVELSWDAPDTGLNVSEYRIYRNGSFIDSTASLAYTDMPGNNSTYTYYVTALYEDGEESGSSNEVSS